MTKGYRSLIARRPVPYKSCHAEVRRQIYSILKDLHIERAKFQSNLVLLNAHSVVRVAGGKGH